MGGEFRFVFYPTDYERTVAFYRDAIGLPVTGGWERGDGDRGTLFEAAGGIVEVLEAPGADDAPHESGPPSGGWISIEVKGVDVAYEQIRERAVQIAED